MISQGEVPNTAAITMCNNAQRNLRNLMSAHERVELPEARKPTRNIPYARPNPPEKKVSSTNVNMNMNMNKSGSSRYEGFHHRRNTSGNPN